MKLRFSFAICLCLAVAAGNASEDHDYPEPLSVGNQSPIVAIFGIPKAQGVSLAKEGETDVDLNLELTSHFVETIRPDENIYLDGETARLALSLRYGIGERWNVGVEIPWLRHGGGFLDGFIIEWHDFWGFKQRGRDEVPQDRVEFRYRRDGVERLDIDSATGGLGDIVVSAQHRLSDDPDGATILHTQVKLPTGDAEELTGSGAVDVGAGIEMARQWWAQWHSTFRAGAVYLGEGDVLPDLQRNWAVYGGLDLTWRALPRLTLRAQYDAHSAPYGDSDLEELSGWSGMLSAGGTWHVTRHSSFDLAVVENLPHTHVVPDVTFQLRWRTTFGSGN